MRVIHESGAVGDSIRSAIIKPALQSSLDQNQLHEYRALSVTAINARIIIYVKSFIAIPTGK